jgi:hypothetical protein
VSDFERAPTTSGRVLDTLVEEAKQHLDVGDAAGKRHVDWAGLETRLMASIEKEKPALLREVGPSAPRRRDRLVRAGALLLASAAAVTLFVRRDADRDVALGDATSSGDGVSASSLRATEGTGDIRIGEIVGTPGYVVRAGDAIAADGARAVFERPRKVSWLLEQDRAPNEEARRGQPAHLRVKSAGESLVLGLDHGVIEAQVVPVPAGEAFAVDIATERNVVRVAVHGTHLRVARSGNRVVVDLTEGVVSIGVPPRTGVTYGTLVTAPAHVELDASDLGTLRVDHSPAAVRTAVPLGSAVAANRPEATVEAQPAALAAAPALETAPVKSASSRPDTVMPAAKVDAPKTALPARDAIAAAVRECATSRSRPGDVHVTVSSSLKLRVSSAGAVESAQFSPPLLPEVQSCAAESIYKTRLDEPGVVTIPIEFSY